MVAERPAAKVQAFGIFLFAQFVVGAGLTILQTASNPYIVQVGPMETAAVRISIMGLLNKSAGVIAPIIFTALILTDMPDVSSHSLSLLSEADRDAQIDLLSNNLVWPYVYLAVSLILLGIGLKFSSLPSLESEENKKDIDVNKDSIFQFPHLILGVITLFMYVGVEVIAGDTIGLFGSELGVSNATSLTSYTMAFMVLGYIVGMCFIPRFINQVQALQGSAILGILISVLEILIIQQIVLQPN